MYELDLAISSFEVLSSLRVLRFPETQKIQKTSKNPKPNGHFPDVDGRPLEDGLPRLSEDEDAEEDEDQP